MEVICYNPNLGITSFQDFAPVLFVGVCCAILLIYRIILVSFGSTHVPMNSNYFNIVCVLSKTKL